MTNRERFCKTLRFDLAGLDRLPCAEFSPWWNETLDRFRREGMDPSLSPLQTAEVLGADKIFQLWVSPRDNSTPPVEYGISRISCSEDYQNFKRKWLYTDAKIQDACEKLKAVKQEQQDGDTVVWLTLEGFFWFPRTLFGIENHLMSFYDEPELLKEINHDCMTYNLKILNAVCEICTPDFMTFAEDLSYNKGPMLSKELFDEFLAPYYRGLLPELKRRGILTFMDSDGLVEQVTDWAVELGIDGMLPLERQSDVDIGGLRQRHPGLLLFGAFDKRVMHLGEEAIRREFDRIFPIMQSGGYIPTPDHQTPPEVSLNDYKLYRKIQMEYCRKAVNTDK